MNNNSSKILISGATGWLGTESVARVLEGSFRDITTSRLILSSSDGRGLNIDAQPTLPTLQLNTYVEAAKNTELEGFIHLAFLTKEKIEKNGFNDYVSKNIELISAACEIIERDRPKWVVIVSSGAIINRNRLEIENNVLRNPYGFCKRIEEVLISDAARKIGANIVIGRLWGATGRHMPVKRAYAISDFIESAKESGTIVITSGGPVIRRYCDAGDFMEVLIKSAISGATTTVDSGGTIIELGELANLISTQMGGIEILRSPLQTTLDDYYPRGSDFEDLAFSVGVDLFGISEQISRTLKSHKVISLR